MKPSSSEVLVTIHPAPCSSFVFSTDISDDQLVGEEPHHLLMGQNEVPPLTLSARSSMNQRRPGALPHAQVELYHFIKIMIDHKCKILVSLVRRDFLTGVLAENKFLQFFQNMDALRVPLFAINNIPSLPLPNTHHHPDSRG